MALTEPHHTYLVRLLEDAYIFKQGDVDFAQLEMFLGRWVMRALGVGPFAPESGFPADELLHIYATAPCHSTPPRTGCEDRTKCFYHGTGVRLAVFKDLYPDCFWEAVRASPGFRLIIILCTPHKLSNRPVPQHAAIYALKKWHNIRVCHKMFLYGPSEVLAHEKAYRMAEALVSLSREWEINQSWEWPQHHPGLLNVPVEVAEARMKERDPAFEDDLQRYERLNGPVPWRLVFDTCWAQELVHNLERWKACLGVAEISNRRFTEITLETNALQQGYVASFGVWLEY